ncbi:hypothetical protein INR49_031321, partial [Caranx melampygus]
YVCEYKHDAVTDRPSVHFNRRRLVVTPVLSGMKSIFYGAGNGTCLFGSVMASTAMPPNGSDLSIQLRGDSTGYVALGLTADASMGTTMLFVCGQNASANNSFFFRTVQRNNSNNELTPIERIVRDIRSSVQNNVIRCEFKVPNVNASTMRSSDATTLSILLGNGTVNGGNGTCLFGSVNATSPVAPNGSNLTIQLRGNSMGYVALGLTVNASMGTSMLFVCGQNASANNSFFFRTVQRNNSNNELTPIERMVRDIRSSVQNNVIRCEFKVPNVNASNIRNSDATTFSILLGNGTVNGSMIGSFSLLLDSRPLNVANPSNPSPSGASKVLHSHALILLLSVLTLVKLIA